MRSIMISLILVISAFPALVLAAFGIRADGKIDQPTLSRAYKESDWEPVTKTLENYLKRKPEGTVSREEKIFAYKYLGVIYAADTVTHTRAESYFNRLLDISPQIEILDMYPSKKILAFFQEAKNDHERQATYSERFDAYGDQMQEKHQATQLENGVMVPDAVSSHSKHNPQRILTKQARIEKKQYPWLWWAAGAVAVGAGVGVYVMTQQQSGKPDPEHVTGDVK